MSAAREPVVRPVGRVQTDYASPAATPVQTRRNPDAVGRVELDARYAPMLEGLAGFDYIWLLSWLDRAAAPDTDGRVTPLLLRHLGRRLGVFATRHPARPNPIGLSVVRLVGIGGATLHIRGVDLTDGTPVLDVKPWQQQLDVPCWDDGADAVAAIRDGWLPEAHPDQVLPD